VKRCAKCNSLMPADAPKCIKCGFVAMQPPSPAPTSKAAPGQRPGKIRGAWLLAKQSWRVLMLDKALLVFPLLSGFCCLLVLASFAAGAFAAGALQAGKMQGDAAHWLMIFVFYFVNYFVIVYFNSALLACAMIRFRGGSPTLGQGIRAANARLPQILAWVLLAATVGVVLRTLQERLALLGRIVVALLGAAWTIATYFIVPVLVAEKLGPFDALKRSAELMKETWGESLASYAGIGAATGLITFLGVLLIGGAASALAVATSSMAAAIAGVVLIAAFLVLSALVSSALSTIVLSALYLYAAEKKVPQAFESVAQFAFAPK